MGFFFYCFCWDEIKYFVPLWYQSEQFHLLGIFIARGDKIDAGRLYAAVSEDIGKLDDVMADHIEPAREQMPQIVREHLAALDPSRAAQRFHRSPYLPPVHPTSAFGEEYLAGGDFSFPSIFQ